MHDDAWWDGDDQDELVASLQRVLAPLRERPPAWGDVLARARIGAPPHRHSRVWPIAMVAGVAAAIAIGWIWGRNTPEPVLIERAVQVASPPEVHVVDVPVAVPLPMPIPIAPNEVREEEVAPPRVRTTKRPRPRAPARSDGEATDVDCILDPRLAKCRTTSTRQEDDALPETLTTADIKRAMVKVKARAQRCGEQHGAQPDEQVVVKLAIAGDTGRVISSFAVGTHAGTALGECVAAAIKTAEFPRFRKVRLGVVYPIVM